MACQEPTELVVTAEALAVSSVLAAVEQKRDLGISPAEESDLDFEWNVFGNVQPDFMEKHVGLKHKDLNINLRGVASAEDIRDALLGSTLYFHPSYVEKLVFWQNPAILLALSMQ